MTFDIEHRPGKKHGNADGLSRITRRRCERAECIDCGDHVSNEPTVNVVQATPLDKATVGQENLCNWMDSYSSPQLRDLQLKDVHLSPVLTLVETSGDKPSKAELLKFSRETRILFSQWDFLSVKDGILYRTLLPDRACGSHILQIVIPVALRRELFQQLHELRTAGHLGFKRTFAKLRDRFYWPHMRKNIKDWCKVCESCARAKMPFGQRQAPLQQTLCGNPIDRVAIDFLGPCLALKKAMSISWSLQIILRSGWNALRYLISVLKPLLMSWSPSSLVGLAHLEFYTPTKEPISNPSYSRRCVAC